jgi:hypothetical protein
MTATPELIVYPQVSALLRDPARTRITRAEAETLFQSSGLPPEAWPQFLQDCTLAHAVITWFEGTYVPNQKLE